MYPFCRLPSVSLPSSWRSGPAAGALSFLIQNEREIHQPPQAGAPAPVHWSTFTCSQGRGHRSISRQMDTASTCLPVLYFPFFRALPTRSWLEIFHLDVLTDASVCSKAEGLRGTRVLLVTQRPNTPRLGESQLWWEDHAGTRPKCPQANALTRDLASGGRDLKTKPVRDDQQQLWWALHPRAGAGAPRGSVL